MKDLFQKIFRQKKESPEIPKTTLEWHTAFRRQRSTAFIIALLLAAVAFFISLTIQQEKHEAFQPQSVFVTNTHLSSSHVITESDIRIAEIPFAYLPENIVTSKEDIIGQYLRHDLSAGEIITNHALKNIVSENALVAQLEENKIALSITEEWFASPFPKLEKNNAVTIMSAHEDRGFESTHPIVSHITVLDIDQNKGARANTQLTLAVTQEEARQLLFAHTEKRKLILLLQAL